MDLSQSETAFASLASEYHARKKLAEQQVASRKWASWHTFDPNPLKFERSGYAPGRWLKAEPTERLNRIEYGLDQERRIVVARPYSDFGFYETFYKWLPGMTERAHLDYGDSKRLLNIEFFELQNDKAVASLSSAINGCAIETYEWTGHNFTTVYQATAERFADIKPELLPNYVAECEYDGSSTLLRVTQTWYDRTPAKRVLSTDIPFERIGKRIVRRHG